MPAHLDGKKPSEERLNEIVSSLDIEDKLSFYPDEPTGNLDEANGQEVIRLLRESARKFNQTIILVTHDLDISKEADRIIQIEDGHIVPSEGMNN